MLRRFVALVAVATATATTLGSCGRATPPVSYAGTPQATARTSRYASHSFLGYLKGGGANPYAGLIVVKGSFYGTTQQGGKYNAGTVFKFAGNKLTVLHSFGATGDGRQPYGKLVYANGALYGTTDSGGKNGIGTIFKITGSKEKVLYSFKGGTGDGELPYAGLIYEHHKFYGTTVGGGTYDFGTAFSFDGTRETVLWNFGASPDGINPRGPLIDVGGSFYGTTYAGGTNAHGTIFKLRGTREMVVYNFGDAATDGGQPYSGLTDVGGTLYGTTTNGGGTASSGGTVFKFANNAETTVYAFKGLNGHDGAGPYAGVIEVGNALYGVTSSGGKTNNGVLFKIVGTHETIVHDFASKNSSDGKTPYGGLVEVKGTLYGTTTIGGSAGDGTVFAQKL
jgi:uncharacterized repeat protein (TIGR03803 family)